MKALITKLSLLGCALLLFSFSRAEEDWPKIVNAADGSVIRVYQPQPESFSGNMLKFRSAISVTDNNGSEPVFGTFWSDSKVETDRDNRQISFLSLNITSIKIPAITDQSKIDNIDDALESGFAQAAGPISLDELLTSIDQNKEEQKLSGNIRNTPPKVIFTTSPSMLVLIDGTPKFQRNSDWNLDVLVNSPFTIVKNYDGQFYLYGAHHWYISRAVTGPYAFSNDNVPDNIRNIEQSLNSKASASGNSNQDNSNSDAVSNIIVSTTPAELIQSQGEPNFTPVEGTNLLYIKNSNNDIFMDVNSQQYFVLISGRWFSAKALNGNNWQYIPADQLPADFAKIPEGSPKDNVLASVAGTNAAQDAVMDAEIPQTAKVDRSTATTNVNYNGRPQFTDIDGTHLQYAVNTSSTVIRNTDGRFYAVDNGVWFVSDNATGPWTVSTERPDDVDRIPPSSPVYNTKYVYIYDVNPDYVYMGYTPGYLNSYIYGPTVVYGTGFYYDPWFGDYYYPRPWSWGFNFGYSPWSGWGFGYGYNYGWFNVGFGYSWGGWRGGWWGPSVYHPAYYGGWHGAGRPYGYYGRNVYNYHASGYVNYNNNIYRNRGGIATRNASPAYNNARPGGNIRPDNITRPGGGAGNSPVRTNGIGNNGYSRPSNNNVYSDRQGNVYQRPQGGQWQQRTNTNRQWAPVNNSRPEVIQNLNRQQTMRDRGQVRTQNFQSFRSAPSSGGGYRPSGGGGGGGRSSGNGGGGRSSGGGAGGRRR